MKITSLYYVTATSPDDVELDLSWFIMAASPVEAGAMWRAHCLSQQFIEPHQFAGEVLDGEADRSGAATIYEVRFPNMLAVPAIIEWGGYELPRVAHINV